ncbi:hypothetical protein PMZ80_007852 [Knufia obscura]|uniref:DUF676 domain-containing protein n=1 Tax=Knufia obscura TaxID=1635080 RepID=A0ABR0RFU6_9EURO|nr:hypothetical protein PMZ80_007852 [Knufia obscura]
MLMLHQTGSVKVGEVVRYTLTYTPSLDRILPPPHHLHLKVRNSSAIPLRAAYLHGPYQIYVSCYPSTFDPNKKHTTAKEEGEPQYEPQLKAGGQWSAKLTVPESVRQDAGLGEQKENEPRRSFTWIIEIASQVLFSTTAGVNYELLVGRDEKSVSLGFSGVVSSSGAPGRLEDHQLARTKPGTQLKGVFTKAVKLRVDDTASLWNTPAFPHDELDQKRGGNAQKSDQKDVQGDQERPRKRRKKIHLVVITHGLHSNLAADMLYMKESIDATAKQAREDAREVRREVRQKQAQEKNGFGREGTGQRAKSTPDLAIAPTPDFDDMPTNDIHEEEDDDDHDDDDEQVLVRGFNGNAVKTEKGIQYLGKRLAKYVLSITYPDQPFLPVKSTITQSISRTFTGTPKPTQQDGKQPVHKGSSIARDDSATKHNLAYQITSISFIGHSLGGLVQTYAIAYIQKHSPEFFDKIHPVNFVAMATPFLGLSNENPIYVKFALDFGLVGRTGQDLGLTWRAPTIARNGWGAVVGGFSDANKNKESDPGAKPLLRILPTGPAHVALKRFRNRSVYSNVVNDGIVPLRTSCLLFLDWRGLGRVEKARRENGLVGTMVNWGLNELTGQNASVPRRRFLDELFSDSGDESSKPAGKVASDPGSSVPQAEASSGLDREDYDAEDEGDPKESQMLRKNRSPEQNSTPNLWSSLTNFFRPQAGNQKQPSPKQQRIYQRGQTMSSEQMTGSGRPSTVEEPENKESEQSQADRRKLLVRGSSLYTNSSDNENLDAPPRTTVFESAGDLLNPPLPPKEFLMDPEARPRTIFHDRVYHPEDIPPPPTKRQNALMRSRPSSSDTKVVPNQAPEDLAKISNGQNVDQSNIRIEERIARAYHKDMTWRKVLVILEPDAHNNIIVRRMFANAYGWPVVKHMCDTHFGYTEAATTRDEDEVPVERAKPADVPAGEAGEEVRDQTQAPDKKIELESDTSKAATTDNMPQKSDDEVETLHRRQKNLQAGLKHAQPSEHKPPRTKSEVRESRDKVPDLVSMVSAQGEPSQSYSSMHSGTAALHRLNRQDSARWSDRFFESSEDEEEEDETDLNVELQKAYDRGLGNHPSTSPPSTRSEKSSRGRSRQAGPGRSLLSETEASGLVAEPDKLPRRESKGSAVLDAGVETLPGSMTGLGLGRDVKDIGDITSSPPRRMANAQVEDGSPTPGADVGVVEQVARARTRSGGEKRRPDLGHEDTMD